MVFFLIHTFKNKILKVCINNCTFVLYFLHSEMPKIFFHNTIKKLLSALMNVAKNKTNLFLTRFRGCDKTKIGCYFYCAFFVNFRRLWRWAKWKKYQTLCQFCLLTRLEQTSLNRATQFLFYWSYDKVNFR